MRVEGKITKKLLKLFGADSPGWHPSRPGQPGKPAKVPKGVSGKQVGGKPGRRKTS